MSDLRAGVERLVEAVPPPAPGIAPVGPRAVELLVRWLELVRTWNKKIDLTAAKDDAALVELGVLDATWVTRSIPEGAKVVDVGTGFGAPGLALACLRPDLSLTLVEPLGKRATFLRTVVGAAKLVDQVEVREAKGEDLAAAGERFAVAISRATLAKEAWIALGARLAPSVVVLLGREDLPPLEGLTMPALRIASDQAYTTSAGAARRVVHLVTSE